MGQIAIIQTLLYSLLQNHESGQEAKLSNTCDSYVCSLHNTRRITATQVKDMFQCILDVMQAHHFNTEEASHNTNLLQ